MSEVGIGPRRYNDFISMMLNFGNKNTWLDGHDGSLDEFKKACKATDKWIADTNGGLETIKEIVFPELKMSLDSLNNYSGDYYKSILHYYSPKGFKASKPGSLGGKDSDEVWLDGPAVYINSILTLDAVREMGFI